MRRNTRSLLALTPVFLASLLLAAAVLCGCARTGGEAGEGPGEEEAGPVDAGGKSGAGTLEVTLYFRHDTPEKAWLAQEKRAVSGDAEPCRAAMEALIAGPSPESLLRPVLPDTVKVLGVMLEGGVCTVNVSKEILTDAARVGASASSEMLALAAIADTLTGIKGVEKVRLLVEGLQSGMVEDRFVEDFWGHVGLPEYLERNEEIIYRGT